MSRPEHISAPSAHTLGPRVSGRTTNLEPHRFRLRPAVSTEALDEIVGAIQGTSQAGGVREALAALPPRPRRGVDTLEVIAVRALLSDLADNGWSVRVMNGDIWVQAPRAFARPGELTDDVKARLRAGLVVSRDRQLTQPSVRAFIRKMETRRPNAGRRVSVLDLVDDGHELANALTSVAALPPDDRAAALERVVRPVVEIATADARCEHTGLALLDVWRYFRHTWSLEYRPTPGRSLHILIRNAARPGAPVMGIAALASPMPQLAVRDAWIGWTIPEIAAAAAREPSSWRGIRASIFKVLRAARSHIRSDDLFAELGDAADDEELERRLNALAAAAEKARLAALEARAAALEAGEEVVSLKQLPRRPDGAVDWRCASESPLFRKKRAEALARLLFAERVLKAVGGGRRGAERVAAPSGDLRRALSIATRELRKMGIASRLLELNVCGAAPPYRDLLAGKLAALSVASAEVIDAYRRRYRDQPGEITSQMAGRAVRRDPSIYVVTTTSLYAVSASQYNRLKLSVPHEGDEQFLHWRDIGLTMGYGTHHFGDQTVKALRALVLKRRRARRVNNIFGEGQSARMRQLREGIELLGLPNDALLKHGTPRRVYALETFDGARAALCFSYPKQATHPPFSAIAARWIERWLVGRVGRREVLRRVARQGPVTVRAELRPPDPQEQPSLDLLEPPVRAAPRAEVFMMNQKSKPEVIQDLYRALSACAEHHDDATVRLLHVETAADAFIRERAPGRILFVTGNPGDGKTHLLRRLSAELHAEGVEVCLDANEQTDNDLVELISKAWRRRSGGLALAINEGILMNVLRAAGGAPWAAQARDLLLRPFVYSGAPLPEPERVAVLDLNLRDTLAPEVVRGATHALLGLAGPCAECPGAQGCDLQFNGPRIAASIDRVAALLDRVSATGTHATMRDLQGLLSFLMTSGRTCQATIERPGVTRPFWRSAFEGADGPLFEALARLDPARVPAPLLDDALWRGADNEQDWAQRPLGDRVAPRTLEERVDAFVDRKRRALFEHRDGGRLAEVGGDEVERALDEVVRGGPSATRLLVRLINRFFDRDEETEELLFLWMTHRYDARAARFAAATESCPRARLTVLVPQLRTGIAPAFSGYRPRHAVLALDGGAPAAGLLVDRPLVAALLAAERGLPATFRSGEPESRLMSFIDRLSRALGEPTEDRVDVRLVDRDTGNHTIVRIDVAGKRYL